MATNKLNSGWSILPPPDPYGPSQYDESQVQQSAPVQPVAPPPKTEAEWLDPHNLTDRLASEYQGEPLHQDPNLKTIVTKKIIYDGWKDRFAGKSPEAILQVLDAMVDDMNLQTSAERDAAKRYAWATIKDNIGKSVQEKADTLRAEIEATRKQKVLTQMQLQNIKDMKEAGYDVNPTNVDKPKDAKQTALEKMQEAKTAEEDSAWEQARGMKDPVFLNYGTASKPELQAYDAADPDEKDVMDMQVLKGKARKYKMSFAQQESATQPDAPAAARPPAGVKFSRMINGVKHSTIVSDPAKIDGYRKSGKFIEE